MAYILLIIVLLLGIGLTNVLAFTPLHLLDFLHIPQWLTIGVIGAATAWIVGDD